ncbi:ATP-grasp domain-containing protein [Chloroflexota bacterium]
MPINKFTSEIPVLLLFNLDMNWSKREQEEVINISSQLGKGIDASGHQTTLIPVSGEELEIILSDYDPYRNIVFNFCESIPGLYHSEWLVAEYLEQHGFTFTGSTSATLALAQEKCRMKQLFNEAGIPTPRWQKYDSDSMIRWDGFPAIVKPSEEHCSEGIDRNAVVMTKSELKNRIRYILKEFRQPALVEDFIDGRELHVSLWGNGRIDMLPPAEMEFSLFHGVQDRICSYEAKFVPESKQYQDIKTVLPAPLSEEEYSEVERVCRAAYRIAGCRDYARVDMRMRDGELYVIDVNPNSDISPDTSTISAAELLGYSYGEFGSRIISLALHRHPAWRNHVHAGIYP